MTGTAAGPLRAVGQIGGCSRRSPVFNQKWQLVALHHASASSKQANEGIRIDVIVDAITATLT